MHPIEIDATLKLAKTRLRSGQVPEAEAMYRRVLEAQPDSAEAVHFLGIAAMTRGKLADALELVRRSIDLKPDCGDYHNNLATVLGRMGKPIETLGAAQQAIDLKAEFPEAHGNKGVALEQLGRLDEAIESYRKAIELRPDYVEALGNLGNALSRKGEHEEGVKCLRRVTELQPRSPDARKNLGNALRQAGNSEQAVTAYRMAVELNPRDADAYNNLGAALQESGQVAQAVEALRTCLSINANHSDAHWNLGLALLGLGDWREGWIQYEWRQHLRQDVGQKRGFPQPVWNGAPIEGRTILLLCEQGLGDTIQFIRYAPLLAQRGAKVIVECQAKLRPLLQTVAGVQKVLARGEPLPDFDVHARLLTLPGIFGTTPDTVPADVPYLHVDEARVARWREELRRGDTETRGRGEKAEEQAREKADADSSRRVSVSPRPRVEFKVGLCWQGNRGHKGDRFRSIPLADFEPLAKIEGVTLVSLQKGDGSEQVEANRDRVPLHVWSDPSDTSTEALLDTAAVMKCLDLVVTCDTAIAHLAGALGVPVWLALPLAGEWRWLSGPRRQPLVPHHAALPPDPGPRLGRRVRAHRGVIQREAGSTRPHCPCPAGDGAAEDGRAA